MYIGYDKRNGCEYAKICKSERINGKVKTTQVPLGRVIDKARGIYRNRARGVFTYDLATDTYGVPDSSIAIPVTRRSNSKEKLILDFGNSFFLSRYITRIGMDPAVNAMQYGNRDSIRAMLMYYILCNMANCNAQEWYSGNYVRILYPKANLESQRISDLLASIGEESSYRAFFKEYAKLLVRRKETADGETYGGEDILIDSTGLPNSIHFPLTAVSNHNGKISNEVRLIYVVQQGSNLPLFFRCIPGNVIDVSTLTKTILELKTLGINTKFAILDAGYLTEQNVRELYENKVSFVSRLQENRRLHKDLVEQYLPILREEENLVAYNGRYAYICRRECELLPGRRAYAYIGLDLAMQSMEATKLFDRASKAKLSESEIHNRLRTQGIFILISSRPIAKEKILPMYYTRQQIEQVFDICKNNANMLPLRVQSEKTLRGHLLLAFTASVVCRKLQEDLKATCFTPESAFLTLGNHKCKVYDGYVITQEAVAKQNALYKKFGVKVDDVYDITPVL